ncbi:MAG TPA: hypothetical protein VMR51_01685 [Patescibacteria group bacterium]|nr:hypothetical protein [Patescibacteria group bacterium]
MILKKAAKTLIVLLIFVGAILLLWLNRYNIHDFIVLRGYKPPQTVAQLAVDDTMSSYGKRLFYVNKPQISDKSSFNSECKSTEQTIVLGCYTGSHIYIYKIVDPTLNGIEQVTAAHEMLHAAYDRLGPSERAHVDALVEAAYKKLNDPRINALADSYQKQEPGSVPNELHSILGTEVSNVGPDLEVYYSKYFSNRAKIVAYAQNYEQVFENLRSQVEKYDADLALRKSQITQKENDLNAQADQLATQKTNLDNLSASGQTRVYNTAVPNYNKAVDNYNVEVANIKSLIVEYNNIVQARNGVIIEQQNLAESIDSRVNAISNQ